MNVYVLNQSDACGDDNRGTDEDRLDYGVFATFELAQAQADELNEPELARLAEHNERAVLLNEQAQREQDALARAGLRQARTFNFTPKAEPDIHWSVTEYEVIE